MKGIRLILVFLIVVASVCSCGNKPSSGVASQPVAEVDTPIVIIQIKDSTLYGRAGDCGMSTFCLICDNGDTIYVDRTSEAGVDGVIYGDLVLDDRFCMITADNNQSLVSAINLTQLDAFVKDYKIINGRLIMKGSNPEKGDTVQIVKLTRQSLVVKDLHGERILSRLHEGQ